MINSLFSRSCNIDASFLMMVHLSWQFPFGFPSRNGLLVLQELVSCLYGIKA